MSNIDLFQVLKYLDTNELALYESFADDPDLKEEYDKLISFVLPVWFTGHFNNENHIIATVKFNDIVNQAWFYLADHPMLQTKLLAVAGIGRSSKHVFYNKKSRTVDKLRIDVFSQIEPDINNEEVFTWCKRLNVKEFQQVLDRLGFQQKEQKVYTKLFSEMV